MENNRDHNSLVIPNKFRTEICKRYHDDATAGHPGIQKTFANISQKYYWLRMSSYISKYVKTCEGRQLVKVEHLLPNPKVT